MQSKAEREAWLAERRNFITASDVAAAMGLNPHKSPKRLLKDKVTGASDDIDRLPAVMCGKHLEPGIFSWHCAHRYFEGRLWEQELTAWSEDGPGPGYVSRITPGGLVRHPTSRVLAATPDGITIDERGLAWATEVKCVKWDKYKFDWTKTWRGRSTDGEWSNIPLGTVFHGTDKDIDAATLRAPVYYWTQLQAQMSCLGIPRGRIVVAFGGQNRVDLDYVLDTAFEQRMLSELDKFWAQVEAARLLEGM